jgi:hypothetical protein
MNFHHRTRDVRRLCGARLLCHTAYEVERSPWTFGRVGGAKSSLAPAQATSSVLAVTRRIGVPETSMSCSVRVPDSVGNGGSVVKRETGTSCSWVGFRTSSFKAQPTS